WWFWVAVTVGIALPVLQIFAITMTANHYLLDAVAGGGVAVLGIAVALVLQRWGYPLAREWLRRVALPGGRRLRATGGGVPGRRRRQSVRKARSMPGISMTWGR